jgi:hypothetical protein
MSFEPRDIGTSGPATGPETAPAQPERRTPEPKAADGQGKAATPAPGAPKASALPGRESLAARAQRIFDETAAAAKAKAAEDAAGKAGEGGGKDKPEGKGASGQGGGKAAPAGKADGKADPKGASPAKGQPDAKADGKTAGKATEGAQRDEHGRFVSGEGGAPAADGKAAKAGPPAPDGKAAPERPRSRPIEGREGRRDYAEVTDAQLSDPAEIDRIFTVIKRESRESRDRYLRAEQAERQLAEKRQAFEREQAAAKEAASRPDPDRLSRRELVELAHSDPFEALKRLDIDPEKFHRRLLSAGTPEARVERLERRIETEREAFERQRSEETEAREKAAREADAERRAAAKREAENDWVGIGEMLAADDSRPTLAQMAKKDFAYVRLKLETAARTTIDDLARRNQTTVQDVERRLTPEQRRTIFARNLDRLEDDLAERFGKAAGLDIDPPAARGGPTTESGAGPRSATTARPEGTTTLTERLSSETTPRRGSLFKSADELRAEGLRAFERAASGRRAG